MTSRRLLARWRRGAALRLAVRQWRLAGRLAAGRLAVLSAMRLWIAALHSRLLLLLTCMRCG